MNTGPAYQARAAVLEAYFTAWLASPQASSCPCAYPRFRAIVAIDCVDYGGVWFCVETETLIALLRAQFEIVPAATSGESGTDTWICKVCGSSYAYGWREFSINVSSQHLKPIHLSVTDTGRPAVVPMPLFGGIVGHTDPPEAYFVPAKFETFRQYFEGRGT